MNDPLLNVDSTGCGKAPVDQCTVATVRGGQTYSRTDTGTPGAQDDIHTTVTGKTVFVDITC